MDATELVELAAAVSGEGIALLGLPGAVSTGGLAGYWAASKCRQQRWSQRLKELRERSRTAEPAASPFWPAAVPLCREVLASEILTRVCAGFWAAFDRGRNSREAEPLARSVWMGHLEARHGVLNLMASAKGLKAIQAESLDLLRRAAERWSDLLVAPLASLVDVRYLAHDQQRLADFADDLAVQRRQAKHKDLSDRLWLRSRIDAFASCRRLATFNADLNAQIAGGILNCFDFDACDETLVPQLAKLSRSLLCERVSTMTADTQLWVASLIASDNVRPAGSVPIG